MNCKASELVERLICEHFRYGFIFVLWCFDCSWRRCDLRELANSLDTWTRKSYLIMMSKTCYSIFTSDCSDSFILV